MALFLGLLNTCKIPESDMIGYIETYEEVASYNFMDYVFLQEREILFFAFNYCAYYLLAGSVNLYIILCSFIGYFLVLYSIWKLHNAINFGKYNFMLSVAVVILFPNLFLLSVHALRQFLAASIMLYVIVENVCYNKIRIIPFVSAIFIHTTSAFLGFIFLPFLKKAVTMNRLLIISVVSVAFVSALPILFRYALFNFLTQFPDFITYGFERLAGNRENAWQTENLSILMFLLYAFVCAIFFVASKRIKYQEDIYLHKFFYIGLVLFLFVACNYNDTEMALRFSFYLYFFVPVAFYFFTAIFNIKYNNVTGKLCFFPIVAIFFFWFIYKLFYGTWTYINIESLTNISWITKF